MCTTATWKYIRRPEYGILLIVSIGLLYSPVLIITHFVYAGPVMGNDFKNYLFGTMQADTILGEGDNDRLFGLAGADKVYGGSGEDIIEGDQGNDMLDGGDGNDWIVGGQDSDKLLGGSGDDVLIASYAVNSSSIRDYAIDIIMCGLGNDTAYINPADNDTASRDCENVVSDSELTILPEPMADERTIVNNSNIF
jgi:hypothetical protein